MKYRTIGPGFRMLLLIALVSAFSASAQAQDAAALYKAKCGTCHGPDGGGGTSMGKAMGVPDMRSDEVQKQTDAQLTETINNGKGKKMPAYKGKLTDDQIRQLVAYLRELAKKK